MGAGVGEVEGRVAQHSSTGGEDWFKGQLSLQPGSPQLQWGPNGEKLPKSDTSPHLQVAPYLTQCPPGPRFNV